MIDGVGLFFLVTMVILGGVIAYVGDILGRRLGKKRLSIGKLRPKHTAALFTGIAGAVATLLTILVLATLSVPVRVWITEGNQARTQLEKLRAELATQQQKLNEAQAQVNAAQSQTEQERQRLSSAQKQTQLAKVEADKFRDEAASLRKNADRLRSEISQTRARLTDFQRRIASLRSENDKQRAESDRLATSVSQLSRDNAAISEQNLRLTATRTNLEGEIGNLKDQVNNLDLDRKNLEQLIRITNFRSALDRRRAQESLDAVQNQLQAARIELNALESRFNDQRFAALTQPIIFQRLDEITRRPVESGLSEAQARREVLAAINQATAIARTRGANPTEPASVVNMGNQSAASQINEIVDAIVRSRIDSLIVVRTLVNGFQGTTIPLALQLYENGLVYTQGSVVGELQLSPTLPEAEIVNRIQNYVSQTLRATVLQKGMVEPVGTDRSLGEITRETLNRAVNDIRTSTRTVRLQFVAASDTRAGDVLLLDLRVR